MYIVGTGYLTRLAFVRTIIQEITNNRKHHFQITQVPQDVLSRLWSNKKTWNPDSSLFKQRPISMQTIWFKPVWVWFCRTIKCRCHCHLVIYLLYSNVIEVNIWGHYYCYHYHLLLFCGCLVLGEFSHSYWRALHLNHQHHLLLWLLAIIYINITMDIIYHPHHITLHVLTLIAITRCVYLTLQNVHCEQPGSQCVCICSNIKLYITVVVSHLWISCTFGTIKKKS